MQNFIGPTTPEEDVLYGFDFHQTYWAEGVMATLPFEKIFLCG